MSGGAGRAGVAAVLLALVPGCRAPEPGERVAYHLHGIAFGANGARESVAKIGSEVRTLAVPSVYVRVEAPVSEIAGGWGRARLQLPPPAARLPLPALAVRILAAARPIPGRDVALGADRSGTPRFEEDAGEWRLSRHPRRPELVKVTLRCGDTAPKRLVSVTARTPQPARLEAGLLDMPPGARVELAFGIRGRWRAADPERFRASLRCAGLPGRTLVDVTVAPDPVDSRWHEREVALYPWERRGCRLVLETGDATANTGDGVWAAPRVLAPAPPSDRPNVVLISLDTLRADHLGAWAYPRRTSPGIDARMVAKGTTFVQASTTFPLTSAAHLGLFTARYPAALRLDSAPRGPYWRLPEERSVPTLVGALRDAGYQTIGITEDGLVGYEQGFARGFDRLTEHPATGPPSVRGHTVFAQAAAAIEQRGKRPFFLFLHTYKVHAPYDPSPQYRGRFAAVPARVGPRAAPVPSRFRDALDAYDESIAELDDIVARFLDTVDALGLAERTLVVLVSDHGEAFGEHGVAGHGASAHQEALDVAIVMRGPGVRADQRVTVPVSLVDVAPTILDLVGLSPLPGAQGRSLVPALRGASMEITPIFFQWGQGPDQRGVRLGRTKLMQAKGSGLLFDLGTDPGELRPTPGDGPAGMLLARQLDAYEATGARARAAIAASGAGRDHVPLSNETRAALRALGYVE